MKLSLKSETSVTTLRTQNQIFDQIQCSFEHSLWPWPRPQQPLHKTVQFMMYQPIKCGCKRISNSVDTVETVIFNCMSLHCDLNREYSNLIFSQDSLAHNDASPYHPWLQNVQQFRRYHPNKHWIFDHFLWPWPWTQQSNLFTRDSGLWQLMYYLSMVAKKITSSEEIVENHILIIWAFTITLKTANQSFQTTL